MNLKGVPLHNFGLEHIFLRVIEYVMENLNCVQTGTIQSFNPVTQTATVTINTKRLIATNPDTWENYPLLVDVPVLVMGGGGGVITFPIKQGDECIILFNDREIDNWFQNGGNQIFSSQRMHDLSDGIAIVGLRSLVNSLPNYNTDDTEIRAESVNIKTSNFKVNNNPCLSGIYIIHAENPGEINSMTFINGLLTNVTVVT